jgi:sugar/nucleoside kinase (ribokinase family)
LPDCDFISLGLSILDVLGRPVDALPEGGGVRIIEEIRWTPAGTAAAPAMVASMLGLDVRLCGAVGDDEMGEVLRRGLERRGVDLRLLSVLPGVRTSATILPIHSNGDRPALHAPGAGLFVDLPERMEDLLSARFLHLGGVGALPKLDGEPTRQLLQAAQSRGVTVTCDLTAPGPPTRPALEAALPGVDYWMPTVDEAREVSGTRTAEDAGRWALDLGAGACVLKDGAAGSLLVNADAVVRFPAYQVEVVDTTGCGDGYCGGFVSALARGQDLESACRFATATAGLVAGRLGSDGLVSSYDETLAFLKDCEPRG